VLLKVEATHDHLEMAKCYDGRFDGRLMEEGRRRVKNREGGRAGI
jgi:hypothetical protein